jgi:phenylacetate-CoA ligase
MSETLLSLMSEALEGDPAVWLSINCGLRDAIVGAAARRTRYYARVVGGAETFEQIPLLTKDLVRDRFEDLVSEGVAPERRVEKVTSGSTGEPLRFMKDLWFGPAETAALLFWKLRHGIPLDAAEVLLTVHEVSEARLDDDRDSHDADRETPPIIRVPQQDAVGAGLSEQVHRWSALGPYWLLGTPSGLEQLAFELQRQGAVLRCPPVALITTGETVTAAGLERLGRALGSPANAWYGSNELSGYVAGTVADKRSYACNPWLAYVEVTDEDGRPVPPGEPGHLVVTDLHNHVMPFIRYDTGDTAEMADWTIGGFRVLSALHGRSSTECIPLRSGRLLTPATLGGSFEDQAVVDVVRGWQCVQTGPNAIEIRVVWALEPDDEALETVARKARLVTDPDTDIAIRTVSRLETLPSGKRWLVRAQ